MQHEEMKKDPPPVKDEAIQPKEEFQEELKEPLPIHSPPSHLAPPFDQKPAFKPELVIPKVPLLIFYQG